MRNIDKFGEYLFDKIFEAVEAKETAIYISPRLYDLLIDIDHPIADELRTIYNTTVKGDKVTLLDYDESDIAKFTYTVPAKLIDFVKGDSQYVYYQNRLDNLYRLKELTKDHPIVWTKNRTSTSIGKVINKMFPNKYKPNGVPGEDIESFTNEVKAERKRGEEQFERFKIVEGSDIQKYYNYHSYDKRAFGGSNLGGSCMRHSSCEDYIEFYAKNSGVKLVILMSEDEEDKIVGRALLWDLEYAYKTELRKFMDRIYYVTDTDMRLFKEFAKRNNWLYKENQNMYNDTSIVDPTDGTSRYRQMQTVSTFKENDQYPYMDTMKYFHINSGYLTNEEDSDDDEEVYFLESTSGDYEVRGGDGIYVDFYGERIPEDDLVYCRLGDDWRYPDDAVWIEGEGDYATEDYANMNYSYSDVEEGYIDNDDATYSEYHNTYIRMENSVDVLAEGSADVESFDDVHLGNTDPRSDRELGNSCFEYEHDGDTYYFDEDDEDYFEDVHSMKYGYEIKAHKIWDADKIFGHKGKKYLNDSDSEAMDKLIGQKRFDF